jgi:hypothetical protein
MPHQIDLQRITLAGIAHRCAQETELFFQRQRYDPRYCFELFRRAIIERKQGAWELVYAQYRSLVSGWVERHPAFQASGEEVQYFVNRAFEKMWAALGPEKFGHFPDLKSVLRYLQMCVHSVIVDFLRLKEQETLLHDDQKLVARRETAEPTVEQHVLTRMQHEDLWNCLNQRLKNDKERRVVYGTFVLALKPRELYARSREMFQDVQEVYRIKENVIARLRRDSELRTFLDDV